MQDGSIRSVVVDEGVVVGVMRNDGEACVRVRAVEGFPTNGTLRVGQFLLGAALGSAKLSFVKMPVSLVESELARLRTTKKGYTLVVAERLPEDAVASIRSPGSSRTGTPSKTSWTRPSPSYYRSNNNNPQELTPAVPRFDIDSVSPARGSGAKPRSVSANTDASLDDRPTSPAAQANEAETGRRELPTTPTSTTPPATPRSSDAVAAQQALLSAVTRHPHEHSDGLTAHTQFGDLARFQQSLNKLRSQRFAIERLKNDLHQRDAKIQALESERDSTRAELEKARHLVDLHSRLEGELQVERDKVDALQNRACEREAVLEQVRNASAATEEFLRSALAQERNEREENRASAAKVEEMLREELNVLRAELQGETHRGTALENDLLQAQRRLLESAAAEEELRSAHAERLASVKRSLEQAQCERDEVYSKLAVAQTEGEASASALRAAGEALAASEQRSNLLAVTLEELEQNVTLLRRQLVESEESATSRLQNAMERARLAERQLAYKLAELQEATAREESALGELENEKAEHVATRVSLSRSEKEADNHKLAVKRLQTQADATEARLEQSMHRLDELHGYLLEERSKVALLEQKLDAERRQCAEWATARLDLLDQFCEEEQLLRMNFEKFAK